MFRFRCLGERVMLIAALAVPPVCAGEFGVTPLRVDLDNTSRNGVITVNNDGDKPLRVTMKLMKWMQSTTGDEKYADSDALLFFPRSMTIDAMDKRVVRIGLRTPIAGVEPEQAFRLFIEEAAPDDVDPKQNQVQFRFRFAIPVFVAPSERKVDIKLESLTVDKSKLHAVIVNSGNETVRFDDLRISADPGWEQRSGGQYHMPATRRSYDLDIPAAECRGGRKLKLVLKSEKATLERDITLAPENCAQAK